MLKKKWIVASYLVLALGLTACSDGAKPPKEEIPPVENSPVDSNLDSQSTQDIGKYREIKVTTKEAYDIFLENLTDAKIKEMKLDYDNKAYYYDVEGYNDHSEYELKIDAQTGEVVKKERENKESNTKEISLSHIEKIDGFVEKAIEDSKESFDHIEWTAKIKNGKAILEIEVDKDNENDVDYIYDLETGKLLEKDQ